MAALYLGSKARKQRSGGGPLILFLVLILGGVAGGWIGTGGRPAWAGSMVRWTDVEERVADRTNAVRNQAGLGRLRLDECLVRTALAHAEAMLAQGFFAHQDPQGRSPGDRAALYCRTLVGLTGENIGSIRGVPPSPDAAAEWFMNNWMNSPGHRENILNRGYTLWGVAVAARDKDIRAVQVFHEIWGMLDQPVPDVLPRSVPLNLGGVGATHWGPPREFDLVDAGGGVRGPWPTSGGRIDAPAGEYRLRFRFFIQEGTTLHYQIVPGPGVLVR